MHDRPVTAALSLAPADADAGTPVRRSRAERQAIVLDTAELQLPGVGPEVRELISPVLLATVLERVSAHLEVKRDHPLTTRRYYKRVAY